MYVHCDVTAVFPWLTYALLSDSRVHKKHRRLYDARDSAVRTLQREVDKRKKQLSSTVTYPLPGKKSGGKKKSGAKKKGS